MSLELESKKNPNKLIDFFVVISCSILIDLQFDNYYLKVRKDFTFSRLAVLNI